MCTDKPKMPTFGEILDVSATKRTISWEHDDKCFSNCSFHFNITLEYIGHENTSQLVNFTTTTRMNITFYNLIPSQNYRLLVSAVCGNLTLSSDPLQVEFNGTDCKCMSYCACILSNTQHLCVSIQVMFHTRLQSFYII